MKNALLAFVAIATASTALAAPARPQPRCPEINGDFTRADNELTMSVKTVLAGGRYIYQLGGQVLVADGQQRTVVADNRKITMVATCSEKGIAIKMARVYQEEEITQNEKGEDVTTFVDKTETVEQRVIPYNRDVIEVASSKASLSGIYFRSKKPKHEPMR